VFQNYALYPHMTVHENMSFGLRLKRVAKDEIQRRVENAARILDISELLERKPKQLSGGQRQRVAMGRAIVRDPRVFLFDEPLSNLDAKLRAEMRLELKLLHKRLGATIVHVTHDQVEAMTLADRVVVMNGGRIEQVGAPQELYHSPATRFVAGFIGSPAMNLLPCALEEASGGLRVRVSGDLVFPVPAGREARYRPHAGRGQLLLGLRPEHITEFRAQTSPNQCPFEHLVDVTEPMGMETLVFLRVNGSDVCARTNPSANAQSGAKLKMLADLDHMHLVDEASGRVL
jgi:multiple sugar transport system ATP-binding protein